MSFSGSLLSGTSLSGGQYYGAGLTVTGEWTPCQLFAKSEVGAWYDPSDLTTLFQDAAGTTPVTAPGQVVGRILDKSGRGNHATQTGATSLMPIYSVEPAGGRRNLLSQSAIGPAGTGWKFFGTSSRTYGIAGHDGALDAVLFDETDAATLAYARQVLTIPADTAAYRFSVYVKAGSSGSAWMRYAFTGGTPVFNAHSFNFSTKTFSPAGPTYEELPGGWFRLSVGIANNGTNTTLDWRLGSNATPTGTGDTGSVIIGGSQIELGTVTTPYQRVVSQYDVTESGVASRHYLAFDGIDDWLQTGTITPGTDKVQVFAGVRKLSDAAIGLIAELSNAVGSYPGSFALFAPGVAAANYMWRNRGSAFQVDASYTNALVAAPVSNVITGIGDISGDIAQVRVDGTQVASSTTDQGTGNYGNYPLYIGRRAGTSLPFNGHIYGLIIRFGPTLTDAQITNTERWLARRTGVTI